MTCAASGLLIAALSWAAFSTAAAQPPPMRACGEHGRISARLGKTWGESRVGFGVLEDGRLVEIFASPGGTWSLLVTTPGGFSCLAAWGDGWQDRRPANKIGFAI